MATCAHLDGDLLKYPASEWSESLPNRSLEQLRGIYRAAGRREVFWPNVGAVRRGAIATKTHLARRTEVARLPTPFAGQRRRQGVSVSLRSPLSYANRTFAGCPILLL